MDGSVNGGVDGTQVIIFQEFRSSLAKIQLFCRNVWKILKIGNLIFCWCGWWREWQCERWSCIMHCND